MLVYPRLELDIGIQDLGWSLSTAVLPVDRTEIITNIKSYCPQDREVLVSLCVRTAFDLLLRSLDLPAGSEIIMSAINIAHMEEIIKQNNCIPIPIDIDPLNLAPTLESCAKSISPHTRILVIAHLFGSIIDLAPYHQLCQEHQILLVEDCAQAFDGWQYTGYSAADLSLFSFGPIKSLTALGGGIALVRDRELADRMQQLADTYPIKSELWFLKRTVFYLGLKILSIPLIFGMLMAILDRLNLDLDNSISQLTRSFKTGDITTQLRYQPPTGMLKLLHHRFQHLDPSHFDRRRHNAIEFFKLLNRSDLQIGINIVHHSYWVVPIVIKNRQVIMTKLRAAGFDSTAGTTSLRAIGDRSINAQQIMADMLYLPISATLAPSQIDRLCQVLKDELTESTYPDMEHKFYIPNAPE